jgi:hypothetical protein
MMSFYRSLGTCLFLALSFHAQLSPAVCVGAQCTVYMSLPCSFLSFLSPAVCVGAKCTVYMSHLGLSFRAQFSPFSPSVCVRARCTCLILLFPFALNFLLLCVYVGAQCTVYMSHLALPSSRSSSANLISGLLGGWIPAQTDLHAKLTRRFFELKHLGNHKEPPWGKSPLSFTPSSHLIFNYALVTIWSVYGSENERFLSACRMYHV